jgi:hypothetical protein
MAPLVAWLIKRRIKKFMLKKLKERLAGTALSSATIGVAAAIISFGTAYQTSDQVKAITNAIIPDSLEGVFIAALGLAVAIARARTLGK